MILNGIKKLQALLKALSLSVLLILTGVTKGNAQDVSINHILAQNFDATNQTLEIITPEDWRSQNVLIGWQKIDGNTYAQYYYVSRGSNIINVAKSNQWSGQIKLLGTNDPRIKSKIKPTSFIDSFKIFLSPNPITPGSINFDLGYSIGNLPFRHVLTGVFLCLSVLCFFWKDKKLMLALFIAFTVCCYIQSLRQIKNQVDQVKTIHANHNQITPFEGFEQFYNVCDKEIDNETWRLQPLSGVFNSYAKYRLANKAFAPVNKNTGRQPSYLITPKPGNRSPIITNQGVSLVNLKNK